MSKAVLKYLPLITIVALLIAPLIVGAQRPPAEPTVLFEDVPSVYSLFEDVMKWIFAFAIVISVIMILFAAFNYVTSGGNDEKVQKASQMLKYVVIGIAVAILAASIPNLVDSILKL